MQLHHRFSGKEKAWAKCNMKKKVTGTTTLDEIKNQFLSML